MNDLTRITNVNRHTKEVEHKILNTVIAENFFDAEHGFGKVKEKHEKIFLFK